MVWRFQKTFPPGNLHSLIIVCPDPERFVSGDSTVMLVWRFGSPDSPSEQQCCSNFGSYDSRQPQACYCGDPMNRHPGESALIRYSSSDSYLCILIYPY